MGKPRKNLRDVDRAIISSVMFEAGIVPMEKTDLDMRRALAQLPPEEARAAKRKFRKLWRKALRAQLGSTNKKNHEARAKAAKAKLGVGKHVPSRLERNARKQLVFDEMWEETIEPLIKNFDSCGKAPKAAAE